MTPPPTIQRTQIDRSGRGRSEYSGIESLADSIFDNGLIQPLVLVPLEAGPNCNFFGLDAGGRRDRALELLFTEGRWDGVLHHAATCLTDPLRPGYVLKGEANIDELSRLQTEIAENLDRHDMPWRDEMKMIVRAWRLARANAASKSEIILMRDYGAMLGCGYMELQAATKVHDDVLANPERYTDVTSIRGAYAKYLKLAEVELTKELAKRTATSTPQLKKDSTVSIQSEPGQIQDAKPEHVIPLTNAFINCDSLEYMEKLTEPIFDHIITDPDYAVSVERLKASVDNAQAGVHQVDVNASLADLFRFITLSFKCVKDQGFVIFFYDSDHHEKLKDFALGVGFRVQRWPLIWHKPDYLSNSAPAYNFTKNYETAMVCRKASAVLSQTQKSSIFSCSSGDTTKLFNHPFAKPIDVWKWIYNAVTIKGQTVYDPFLGGGSSAVAAAQLGLRPVGSEINEEHYHNALHNIQSGYRKLLGNNVTFS